MTSRNVEICHVQGAWRVGVEGENLLQGSYRTLEEALDVARGLAARLKVALSIGKDRAQATARGTS